MASRPPFDPADLPSAEEIARRVRAKEQSALEAVDDALDRIEQQGDRGAVTFVAADQARASARDLDRRIAAGEPVGPLAGVPTLVKDLYGFVPGWPATFGGIAALSEGRTPPGLWSTYPRAMTAADAILLGLTNSPAFGFRGVTDNPLFGPTQNPFDPQRNAGGSSGGSAAGVAAGLVPVAGASDAGGSIRIPAAWTNTFGFQPTAGRVPSTPRPVGFHLAPYLYEGPVSRTVTDAALVMNALQGHDPHDPTSIDSPVDLVAAMTAGVRGLRIGFTEDFGGFPVDPQIRDVIAQAVQVLAELGAVVEPLRLELGHSHVELTELWLRTMGVTVLTDIDEQRRRGIDLTADGVLPAEILCWADHASTMTTRDILRDRAMRTAVLDGMLSAQERFDLIVGPTVVALPVANRSDGNTVGPREVAGVPVDPLIGWCPTYLTNYTGAPSCSIPAGFAGNLPVGMQIVGRKFRDGDVFAAAAAFERAAQWQAAYARASYGV